jgi:hypothetical protein
MMHDGAASPAPDPNRRGGPGPKGPADPTEEYVISVGDVLDHNAAEPPPGTIVETNTGQRWKRLLEAPATYSWWQWVMTDGVFDYPHTRWQWALVTNQGPVTVVRVPGPVRDGDV